MNVCELRIAGAERDAELAAARWELFVCPDVRHVYRIGNGDRVAVLYEGAEPDLSGWLAALTRAGYVAGRHEPSERALEPV